MEWTCVDIPQVWHRCDGKENRADHKGECGKIYLLKRDIGPSLTTSNFFRTILSSSMLILDSDPID